jgi:hypothetical protein
MTPIRLSSFSVIGAVVAIGLSSASGPFAAMAPRDLLRSVAQFTDAEWAMVERGDAVAKVLDTDSRQVAVAGAVRIHGSREQLARRSRDLDVLGRSAAVLDAGAFSAVPSAADLRRATFEETSLDLRNCRPGDCQVRLGAEDIAQFHREVNWNGSDWRDQSARVWREVLARYAAAYQSSGRKALPDYANKRETLSVAGEVSQLANEYGFVSSYSPELAAYLHDFGAHAPSGAHHLLYWTKEDFGIRPVFRISHQLVYQAGGAIPATLIVINQVYADHYLDAALTVTVALDSTDRGGNTPGRTGDFYMISVTRARTRSLSGVLRRLARSTVQSRSRETMRRILTSNKGAIESSRP